MSNDLINQDDDDGYGGSITGGRLIKGTIARFTDGRWSDRDGMELPSVLLALAISEALQKWEHQKPTEVITDKPLPDVNELNASVPRETWEAGLDGQPKPPWVHQHIVYLIDPGTGAFLTFVNSTIGARIAVEQLKESVIVTRHLRNSHVVPVVKPTSRPMKTRFGQKMRPHFEIIGWRQAGSGGSAINGPQAPQIGGPTSAAPTAANESQTTLDQMAPVEPVSLSEEMGGDKILW